MPLDVEAMAAEVVLLVKSALAPVLERLAVAEARLADFDKDAARIEGYTSFLQRDAAALTERVALAEKQGGPQGPAGPAGAPGADGQVGPAGPQGERGPQGEPGPAGPAGMAGEKGLDGANGRDGRDGMPGIQGEKGLDGKDGLRGEAGLNGTNGRDGTLENLKAMFDGERTVTLCFKNGDPIEGGVIKFDVPLYRGVWMATKQYETGDTVTWSGSTWIAKQDTTAKPGELGEPSRAWQLAVKAGRDGRPGSK